MNITEERRAERVCALVRKLSIEIDKPHTEVLLDVLQKEREIYYQRKHTNDTYRNTYFFHAIGNIRKNYR